MVNLWLFRFEQTPHETLVRLGNSIENQLPECITTMKINPTEIRIPVGSFKNNRQQYLANPFLKILSKHVPTKSHGLALVNLDLFVPKLNFIFGLAEFDGNAIIALPRLLPEFYGYPENETLYYERIRKEVLHELGHILGLTHCHNYCVMRFSNSLSDTDNKPAEYCSSCLNKLL
jgi:archaemetzincin